MVCALTAESLPESTTEPTVTPEPTATVTQAATPSPTPSPTPVDRQKGILNFIKDKDIRDIKVEGNSAFISFKPQTIWNETDALNEVYIRLVNYSGSIFAEDSLDIDTVGVDLYNEYIDEYGKSSDVMTVSLIIDKQTYEKYDWKKLRFQPIYETMRTACSKHFIIPTFMRNVNRDNLYLKP